VPRAAFVQRTLEHKLWFDELYDRLFYAPAAFVSTAWMRWVERPVLLGSATEIGVEAQHSGRLVARAQSGLLRAYVLALAFGIAVLLLVFVAAR
jgi:NADH:ubiquinone oxidoreductase subunit 5 (subunit L)/multisubunit Na+/H+ antiporter MnhA subunit